MAEAQTTECHLSIRQRNAVDLLATGLCDREVAEQVGCARETVTRWRQNPYFVAALNRQRREMWAAYHERLRAMVATALDAVEGAIKGGDTKAALAILEGAGVLGGNGPPGGQTDAEAVLAEEAEALATADYEAEERARRAGNGPAENGAAEGGSGV